MDLSFYKGFADQVIEATKPFLKIEVNTRILEIGSGAAGIVTHLNSKYRFSVDPLEEFYSRVKKFADYRDKNVIYKKAVGEPLPFEGKQFDLIIIDNVLDHCDNPALVISEMKRVLKENGIVFLRQNTYHIWGKFIRMIMEF
jgi:SAM-dependent methyltransferase